MNILSSSIAQYIQNEEDRTIGLISISINNNFLNPLLTEKGKDYLKSPFDDKKQGRASGLSASIGLKLDEIKYDFFVSYTGNQKWEYSDINGQKYLFAVWGVLFGTSGYYNLFNIGKASIYGGGGIGISLLDYSFIKFGYNEIRGIFLYPALNISYPIGKNQIDLYYSFVKFILPPGSLNSDHRSYINLTNHSISIAFTFVF